MDTEVFAMGMLGRKRKPLEEAEPKIPPTYDLCVMNKATDGRCRVGAGWLKANGTISIVLNP